MIVNMTYMNTNKYIELFKFQNQLMHRFEGFKENMTLAVFMIAA